MDDKYKCFRTYFIVLILLMNLHLKLGKIKEKIKRFVPNPSLDKAKEILNTENCVVISGAPDVERNNTC